MSQFRDVCFIWNAKLDYHLLNISPWFIFSFHLFSILHKNLQSTKRTHSGRMAGQKV